MQHAGVEAFSATITGQKSGASMSRTTKQGVWAILIRLASVVIASTICSSNSQNVSGGQQGSANVPKAPGLRFEAITLQLGEIRSGLPVACQFAFINTGQGVVELVEARPGCGCLKPQLPQRQFGPGKRGIMPLELKTLGQPAGPHTWQLVLVYRDGDQLREQALHVTATVVTEVTVQPASLTLFTDGSFSHEVILTDLRTEPLQNLIVQTSSPFLRATAGPFNKDGFGNSTCSIKVETSGELPVGRHDEMLVIHTSDPLYNEFTIPITVIKQINR
jgi:Protein of unknown function (DUF1573)